MVWSCFPWFGKGDLVSTDTTMNAVRYTEVLEEALLLMMVEHYPNGSIFQQDNAPVHTAMVIKK